MTVAELEARTNADELTEWAAYYRIEPWGSALDWMMHARLMSLVHKAGWGKDARGTDHTDFLIDELVW